MKVDLSFFLKCFKWGSLLKTQRACFCRWAGKNLLREWCGICRNAEVSVVLCSSTNNKECVKAGEDCLLPMFRNSSWLRLNWVTFTMLTAFPRANELHWRLCESFCGVVVSTETSQVVKSERYDLNEWGIWTRFHATHSLTKCFDSKVRDWLSSTSGRVERRVEPSQSLPHA